MFVSHGTVSSTSAMLLVVPAKETFINYMSAGKVNTNRKINYMGVGKAEGQILTVKL